MELNSLIAECTTGPKNTWHGVAPQYVRDRDGDVSETKLTERQLKI